MSQTPRNPFETGNDQFDQTVEQKQGSNTWMWVLGIVGGLILLSAVACCGVGAYMWSSASGMIAEAAVEEFADDPVVVENIGTITESSMSFSEAVTESSKDEDISAMVFQIKGDKGSGKLIHRTNIETGEVTVVLEMDNGETFELEYVDEFEDFEMSFDELEEFENMEPLDVSEEATSETPVEQAGDQ